MADINNKTESTMHNKCDSINKRNSLYNLAKVLVSESNSGIDEDTVTKRLNSKGGIIKQLKNNLNFDIKKIAQSSEDNKYEMYELLKIIYKFNFEDESDDEPANKTIMKIFQKPTLKNLITEYSPNSRFGNIYFKFLEKIIPYVDDVDNRYDRIYDGNCFWEQFIGVLKWKSIAKDSLERIEYYSNYFDRVNEVAESVLHCLEKISQTFDFHKIEDTDGVFNTFFNLLVYFEINCNNEDRIKINSEIYDTTPPSQEYIERYRKNRYENVNINELEQIEKYTENLSKLSDNELWDFITYGEYNENDKNSYRFAIKNYMTVVHWLFDRYLDEAKNEEAPAFGAPAESGYKNMYNIQYDYFKQKCSDENFDLKSFQKKNFIIAVFQELVNIHKNKYTFSNKYLQYNNTNTSLTKAIKDGENADAVIIKYVLRRVDNRVALNSGVKNLFDKEREIIIKISHIKELIFKYQNINDMYLVNEICAHYFLLSTLDDDMVNNFVLGIVDCVGELFGENKCEITEILMPKYNKSIVNVYKELIYTNDDEIFRFKEFLLKCIRYAYKLYERDSDKKILGVWDINIAPGVKGIVHVSIFKDKIIYDKFEYSVADVILNRIESLGLEPLIELFSTND